METIELVSSTPLWLIILAVVIGLVVGSFLNVVIYRLPIMLFKEWKQECELLLAEAKSEAVNALEARFNLNWPCSHCPQCKAKVPFYYNIPLLSFMVLRGRCHSCKGKIAWRYPLVELITAVLSGFLAWYFGWGIELVGSLIFTWMLIPLLFIDLDHQLLPDNITLPLLWIGLLINIPSTFANLSSAVLGAVIGYVFFWAVYWIFKLVTKKEGMGYGDFKLLAALAAWTGWQYLLVLVLLSALLGLVSSVLISWTRKHSLREAMPYGPALTIAGWVTLVWGANIIEAYNQFFGMSA